MSRLLGVGALQMPTVQGDVKKNLDTLEYYIKAIKTMSPWVKMVCANELYFQGPLHMEATAQTIPGPITEACCEIARRYSVYLIAGSIYEKSGQHYYNTTPVISPEGNIIVRYRKMYPWRPIEKTTAGNSTVIFELPDLGTVGICICYDLWFPELIRDLVWKGAELIVIPTLSGTQDRSQEIILARAAAITNQCYILSINGAAPLGRGESLLIDPEGRLLQHAGYNGEYIIAMLDLDQVSNVRRYGTVGVSYPVVSFLVEEHRFDYQTPNALPSKCLAELAKVVDLRPEGKKHFG